MLVKCLWKMFSCDDSICRNGKRPHYREVLDACMQAIETLPERKDSRQEPVLEPHYKLVSIVHKLVERKVLEVRQYHRMREPLAD